MLETLLRTKLFVPPQRPKLVPRPQLIERLNQGLQLGRRLTLISAPAGFGKTTLVREWVGELSREDGRESPPTHRIAWLSLDENDNDATRFLTYLVTALNQFEDIDIAIGKGALSMLQSPQPQPIESVLISLINDLITIPGRIILTLDDYHLIASSAGDDALAFLLERLPLQLHLVIATREDPQLPLSRLRARDQLTELRATDLRFTSFEAAEFLNQTMGLALSEEDIRELETHTEGWIAGLQLAAISLKGREDTTKLIRSFSGSHRLVLDYLIEEVLDQQTSSIRTFLLQTAILNRFTSLLCDALTGQDNGQATLEMLERSNLFIVPLDEERRWYRYHHLFADLLRRRLRQKHLDLIPTLHLRASVWYEQNGFIDEAIEHALRQEDFERAADLIEEQAEAIWERGEHAKLLRWTGKIPREILVTRPNSAIFLAWVQLEIGEVDEAISSLQAINHLIHSYPAEDSSANRSESSDPKTSHLKSRILVMRAMIGFRQADVPSIIKYAREALKTLPNTDLSWRAIAAMALGDSQYIAGDMNAANSALSEAIRISREAGNLYIMIYASIKLAIILQYQCRLHEALTACRELMAYMESHGLSESSMNGVLHAELGEILLDLDDIDQALELVSRGIRLSEHEIDLTNLAWTHLVLVKVLYARNEYAEALRTISKLEKMVEEAKLPPWIVSRIAAWKAKTLLAQGNINAVQIWVQERQLQTDDDVQPTREVEYLVLARFILSKGNLEEAVPLLERLHESAEAGGRVTRMIEMQLISALILHEQGELEKALSVLKNSITLAQPEEHIRLFVNEGPAMARLLSEALNRGIAPDYVRRLLAAFPIDEPMRADLKRTEADQSELVEPLSERELEVLQLIAQGLTNREIASRLYLSLHTVKAHSRNIYSKLGVHNRTRAVSRGRALGILPPH
jgi:LuxR family maltose regulon positive regulatory protein